MTITEQILNLLEMNESIPALVLNQFADVVAKNDVWSKYFNNAETGKSFYNIFDKNTSLLIKSSLIDSKTFQKVKTREIQYLSSGKIKNFQLVISPFKIQNNLYFYFLIYDESHTNNFIVYPTIDDFSYYKKYEYIFNLLKTEDRENQIINNLKYYVEIEKEPIALKDFSNFLLMNQSFRTFMLPEENKQDISLNVRIKTSELLLIIYSLEKEIFGSQNIFVIENTFPNKINIAESSKILIFPFIRKNETLIIGKLDLQAKFGQPTNVESPKIEEQQIKSDVPTIIYDANNFDILDVNKQCAEIYGYDIDELKKMNLIELFPPEDMQKLLSPEIDAEKIEYTQIKKDGNKIKILAKRENTIWQNRNAYLEIIEIADENEKIISEEKIDIEIIPQIENAEIEPVEISNGITENNIEVINTVEENSESVKVEELVEEEILENKIDNEKLTEIPNGISSEQNIISDEIKSEEKIPDAKPNFYQKEIAKDNKEISPFLSFLFHELLTPVNVILGFVQEIIDSIDNLSEEQEESAKIIKENQQILLQTMNSAVQYAKLEENLLPIKVEEFNFKNHILDIEESVSRLAEKQNVKLNFTQSFDKLILQNDRQKLLAAISYFLKLVINLTETKEVFVKLHSTEDNLIISVKDKLSEISENLLNNILELYNSPKSSINNNLGLSSITLRLSQKLNDVIFAKVTNLISENINTASLVIPINIDKHKVVSEQTDFTNPVSTINELTESEKEIPADNLENKIDEIVESEIDEKNIIENDEMIFDEDDLEEFSDEILHEEISEIKLEDSEIVLENEENNSANSEMKYEETKIIFEEPKIPNEIDEIIIEDFSEDEVLEKETEIVKEEKTIKKFNISEISCLFIDDSIDAQLLFKSQMHDLKQLSMTSNLIDALPLLEKFNFDIILVDINLNHKFNGFDALKIIRQFSDYKTTPIAALTAYPFEGDREKFLMFGFTDYFVKPLLRENLLKSFEEILS
ncbi:MAG: response regulator [Ignavibacteriae bacterium]|nr:response regulator [Ignavibacteriota bacterium]